MNISAQGVDDFVPTRSGSGELQRQRQLITVQSLPRKQGRKSELIIEMMPSLRAFARSLTRNASEADDRSGNALEALASLRQFRPGTSSESLALSHRTERLHTNYRKRHRECTVLAREVEDILEQMHLRNGRWRAQWKCPGQASA